MQNPIIFCLNQREFPFPCSFKLLKKLPSKYDDLSDLLISQHRYDVQSPIRDETFQKFLDAWQNETTPELDNTNIWEFYLLSKEFGLFNDYIASPRFQNMFSISFLIHFDQDQNSNIQFTNNFDKSEIERQIAINLNEYLNKTPNELFQIPINSLYNIFYHPERNLTDHQKAYQLILNSAAQDNKLYVLLESIDGSQINSTKIRTDSILHRNEHLGFFPQNITLYDHLTIENDQLKLENEKLKKENEKLKFENSILTTKINPKLPTNGGLNHFISAAKKITNCNKEKIEANASMTRVILMGLTGSGKSCIINSLLNKPLKIVKVHNHFDDVMLEGEGVMNSEMAMTIEPNVYVDKSSRIIFYEYKHEFDNYENYYTEILNSFIIDKLFQKINGHDTRIKILFVCSQGMIYACRARLFFQVIEYMKKLYCNFDQIKDRIGLVMTKTDPSNDTSDYIDLLHTILHENQSLFNDLQNVFICPRPQMCDIGKNYVFNDYERLVRFIHTDPIVNPQVNIILSDKAFLNTIEFRKVYTVMIMQAVNKLCTRIKSNLTSVTELRKINHLINSIEQINTNQIRDIKDVERILREKIPNSDQYNDDFTNLDAFNPLESFLNKVLNTLEFNVFDPDEVTKLLKNFIGSWKDNVIIDLMKNKMDKVAEK